MDTEHGFLGHCKAGGARFSGNFLGRGDGVSQETDQEDIAQTLFLKLAGQLPAEHPDTPSWRAFVTKTIRRQVASLIRDQQAQKRDYRRACSLYDVIDEDDEGSMERIATIGGREIRRHRGCWTRSGQELAELALDLAECIAELPDERHRELCERLQHNSLSRVAREMDIPRSTLHEWVRRIRQRFEQAGLQKYFEEHSSSSYRTG